MICGLGEKTRNVLTKGLSGPLRFGSSSGDNHLPIQNRYKIILAKSRIRLNVKKAARCYPDRLRLAPADHTLAGIVDTRSSAASKDAAQRS